MKPIENLPDEDAGEAGLGALRIVLAGAGVIVPGAAIGGELLLSLLGSSVRRRQEHFLRELATRVNYLLDHGLTLEKLENNEAFVSATLKATQSAMRSEGDAKREALRNAVLNVATGKSPNETLQHIFFELIDRFSEMHLRVLEAMRVPKTLCDAKPISVRHSIYRNVPALKENRPLVDLIWNELHAAGLVQAASTEYTMQDTGGGSLKQTTPLGDQLLSFITEP